MAITNYLGGNLLDHSLGISAYSIPSDIYVALFTTEIDEDGTGIEVSGAGYARQLVNWGVSEPKRRWNTVDINFDVVTTSWGKPVYFAIFDALSGGNMLYFGELYNTRLLIEKDKVIIPANGLTISY